MDVLTTLYGDDHRYIAATYGSLAATLVDQGRHSEALELARTALDQKRALLPSNHLSIAQSQQLLGNVHRELGHLQRAESLLREALRTHETEAPSHYRTSQIRRGLGEALLAQNRPAAAEPLLLEAYRALKEQRGPSDDFTQRAVRALVDLYAQTGESQKREKYRALLTSDS